jgi:hypothetical protein
MSYGIHFFFILILLFSSCSKKEQLISDLGVKQKKISVYIEMPRNALVFDNIAPLLYQALHKHMLRVGYVMANSWQNGYTLRTNIKSLEPINKLVSANIILFHYTVKIEVECILLDFNQTIVAQKTFLISSLISKPNNPILNSDFLDYEYKRLFERSSQRIERFFRNYLLDTVTKYS